jgi:hypothetical protein
MTQAVVAAGLRVAADDALASLAWYCHARLFRGRKQQPDVERWPYLSAALGSDAGLFYVLVLLSGTPQMQETHRARGIPERVVHDTLPGLQWYLKRQDDPAKSGHWGITTTNLVWLLYYWRGWYYRIGRLMFIPSSWRGHCFPEGIRVFRHASTRQVIALSEDGVRYRADGQIDGAAGVHDPEGAWTATLHLDGEDITGHPIAPQGHAVCQEVRLPAREWTQVLAPGDPTLEIHIPHGSPLSHDLCGESIREALAFFPRHFPDRPFAALTCFTWFMNGQFEELLPPSSNIVRFLKEVYLFPRKAAETSTRSTLWHVSGEHPDYPIDREGKTSMQQAFERHVADGGHFAPGGCFLLPEDFDWGKQVYRSGELPWER